MAENEKKTADVTEATEKAEVKAEEKEKKFKISYRGISLWLN
jgi:hypothetical protein